MYEKVEVCRAQVSPSCKKTKLQARGLCGPCYTEIGRQGRLDEFSRTQVATPAKMCAVVSCPNERFQQNLMCQPHAWRKRKYGDPLGGGPLQPQGQPDADRFWPKVLKAEGDGCWEIPSPNRDGFSFYATYLDGKRRTR